MTLLGLCAGLSGMRYALEGRFGTAAVRSIADRCFGVMVGLNGPTITRVPLADVVGRTRNVPLDSDIITTVRDLGISLGD